MSWSSETQAVVDRLGPMAQRDVSLAPFCTYRVGGRAAALVVVESTADLETLRDALRPTGPVSASRAPHPVATLIVGRGSNLLVADEGFDGIAVQLGAAFSEVTFGLDGNEEESVSVVVGGAALLPVVARQTASAGLRGFEWAVGVPGSVGGAVRMNAGGHGSDIAASLLRASVFDLRVGGPENWDLDDLALGYRKSAVAADQVVLFAELRLQRGDAVEAEREVTEIVRWRREHQPGGANAGSVFANPDGDSAGRLVEAAGLKGHRLGTAAVSSKHANFIQADADGSADDVFRLIRHVRRVVHDTFGVLLRPENRLVGFDVDELGDDDMDDPTDSAGLAATRDVQGGDT